MRIFSLLLVMFSACAFAQPAEEWVEVVANNFGCRVKVLKQSFAKNPGGQRHWYGPCNRDNYAHGIGEYTVTSATGRVVSASRSNMNNGIGTALEIYTLQQGQIMRWKD